MLVYWLAVGCSGKQIDLDDTDAGDTEETDPVTAGMPTPHVDSIHNQCDEDAATCTWWVQVSGDLATATELEIAETGAPDSTCGPPAPPSYTECGFWSEQHSAFSVVATSGDVRTWALTLALVETPEEQVANESTWFDVSDVDLGARLTLLATAYGAQADDCLVSGHDPNYYEVCPESE